MDTIKVSFDPSSLVNSDVLCCVQRLYVVPSTMVLDEKRISRFVIFHELLLSRSMKTPVIEP